LDHVADLQLPGCVGEQTQVRSPRSVAQMNWKLPEDNWRQLTDKLKRRLGTLIDAQLDLWTGQHRRPAQPPARKPDSTS
jgi:hypothetical protein